MRDANLFFRNTSASLVATETAGSTTMNILTINGTPADGLAVFIDVPKKAALTTLAPTLLHSTDGTTFTLLETFDTYVSATAAVTAAKKWVRRFHTRAKYVGLTLTAAGTGTTDFGAVVAGIGDDDQWNLLGVGQNPSSLGPV